MTAIDLKWTARPSAVFTTVVREPGTLWLDDATFVRPTLMACHPEAQLIVQRNGRVLQRERGLERASASDPLRAIRDFIAASPHGTAPWTAGFLAFDLAPRVEPRLRARTTPESSTPLAYLARYAAVLRGEPFGVAPSPSSDPPLRWSIQATTRQAAHDLMARLDCERLGVPACALPEGEPSILLETPDPTAHERTIERALSYIGTGDVYQVNLAARFRVANRLPPHQAYLRMRALQPVRHGAFLDTGDLCVLLNSPERFLRISGDRIETKPIKGTRPRGTSAAEDRDWVRDLRTDPKERAEHVMIVDLERNDLGRVCRPGTVAVVRFAEVESYATLHHLVSTVRGRLRPDVGLEDVLRATFPGGSITGAPKIRATEIIAELEAQPREIYTGAFLHGRGPADLDAAIAIRVAVWQRGIYTYHAGGGIVADSDPRREYEECLLKASPFLDATSGTTATRTTAHGGDAWPDAR